MDIPNIKNVKIGLQTLRLLNTPMEKLRLVLNRANSKVKLDVSEVERTLQVKADALIPSDVVVPQSVNKGIPVVLAAPEVGGDPGHRAARRPVPPDRREAPVADRARPDPPRRSAMSLYKRLHDGGGAPGAARPACRDPVLDELRQKIHHHLIDELGPILYDKRLSEDDLRRRVHEQLHAALAQERAPLSAADKAQLIQDVSDDILGYGPIDRLLKDEDVTEVMVNGPDSVYVERSGKLEKTDATLRRRGAPPPHHRQDRERGRPAHRRVQPAVDARLPDGSRVNAVIHPLAIGGPFLTIRKFSKDPFQIDDLIRFGTLNAALGPLPAGLRGRAPQHDRLRRYRYR